MKTLFFQQSAISCAVLAGAFLGWARLAGAAEGTISDYKIEPLDTIYVDVFGETNLCRECKVQANGEIRYPLLTNVMVAGSTTVQVADGLKALLGKDYLVNPQVTVTVKQYRERTVSVLGQVTKPLAYVIPEEQQWSIVDAIAHAGGLTKLGKKSKIEFTRNGVRRTFNFDQLLKDQNDPKKIIWLEAGDVINVPETLF